MALTYTPSPDLGNECPDFDLPAVDGKRYRLSDFKLNQPLLVMFICNHCPYVKAVEDRLIQLGSDLKAKGISVIAIASNDAQAYPEDSFENLKKRSIEKNYPFVYLFDETQAVAKKFGAVCTPDFFVYDKNMKLQYRGRLDDSWKNPAQVSKRELYEAALQIQRGESVSPFQPPSMGCSIKWREA